MNTERQSQNRARLRRFKSYTAYKNSGVEWLGEIPAHWEVKKLSWVTECLDGRRIPLNAEERGQMQGEYPYWGANSIVDYVDKWLFDEELVLLGEDGAPFFDRTKPVAFCVSGKIWVNNHAHVLRPRRIIKASFLTYALNCVDYRVFIDGTTRDKLTQGDMNTIPIQYPEVIEQRSIAAFLDHETARIYALVARKERLIELLQEKRTALITRAVTKGLDPNFPVKDSGVQWLGEIPAHWTVTKLIRLTDPAVPIVYGILLPGPRLNEGVPYIGAGDVKDQLRLDDLPRTTQEIASQYPRSCMRAGEIVYAIRGSFGAVEIVPPELDGVNLSRDTARVSPRKTVVGRWLCWALRSSTSQNQFDFHELGATITGVNIRDLKRVFLPYPPEVEQEAIADYLDKQTEKLDALISKVRDAIGSLKELRTALISAAVTGKIDVREELHEP